MSRYYFPWGVLGAADSDCRQEIYGECPGIHTSWGGGDEGRKQDATKVEVELQPKEDLDVLTEAERSLVGVQGPGLLYVHVNPSLDVGCLGKEET